MKFSIKHFFSKCEHEGKTKASKLRKVMMVYNTRKTQRHLRTKTLRHAGIRSHKVRKINHLANLLWIAFFRFDDL